MEKTLVDQSLQEIVDTLKGKTHPLHRTWACWMIPSHVYAKSEAKLMASSIDSVEKFWVIEPHMKKVSYHYLYWMNTICKPKWEDPLNQEGCRWIFHLEDLENAKEILFYFVLGIIGETLMQTDKEMDALNGVELQTSPPKLKIWMRNITDNLNFAPWIKPYMKKCKLSEPVRSANKADYSNPPAHRGRGRGSWR